MNGDGSEAIIILAVIFGIIVCVQRTCTYYDEHLPLRYRLAASPHA